MAMITCPECGKEISEKAKICPNCGAPIAENTQQGQHIPQVQQVFSQPPKNSKLSIVSLILSIIGCTYVIGLVCAIVDLTKKDGRKHTISWISIGICAFWLVITIAVSGGSQKNADQNLPSATEETLSEESAEEAIEEPVDEPSENKEPIEEPVDEPSKNEEPADEPEAPIEYISVTAQDLSDALSSNAMKAKNDYEDQYVEVTGELHVIDSDGKYISLSAGQFDLTNIQCYIKSEDQKQIIMEKSMGDTITIKGYCKDVGEIMGYQIDIEEVE